MLLPKVCRILAAAAVLALSPLLSSCGADSTSPDKDWDSHVKDVQQRGAPLLRAIYKFQASCGLWPYTLDELVPDYAGSQQVKGWDYTWHAGGWWQLTNFGAFPDALLRYKHVSADKAGWIATDGDSEAWLKGGEIDPPAVDVTDKERDAVHLAVLRSRGGRYKDRIVHHQGLICWYYTHGDYQSAYEACEKCLKRWPTYWWPNLMMAYIEFKLGRTSDGDERLERFATDNDDLSHWYLTAIFHLEAGQPDKARQELARSAKVPLVHLLGAPDDGEVLGWSAEAVAWDAAVLCYKQEWLEESLAICDQWERFCRKQGYGDKNYCAIRAACYLAQGKNEEAHEALAPILEQAKHRNPWAKHLDDLDSAIERKDRDYHYEPGSYPPPFSVLVEYE